MTPDAISDRLQAVQDRIASAALRAGRKPQDITLVAVSKTKPLDLIQTVHSAGQLDFGENKVQEMADKQPQLPQARWHLIGGLQRNKVKYIAPVVHLIHSLDSEKLMKEIDKRAAQADRIINCLIQINISDEEQKGGATEDEAQHLIEQLDAYPHVSIQGVMGMAAFTDDEAVVRSQFQRLKRASESLGQHTHPRLNMHEISMGMSGDYEWAIEEGATMVRVGSAIFGMRG